MFLIIVDFSELSQTFFLSTGGNVASRLPKRPTNFVPMFLAMLLV